MKRVKSTTVSAAVFVALCMVVGCGDEGDEGVDCEQDNDCSNGYFCQKGECKPKCTLSSDCPNMHYCETTTGQCKQDCTDDSDCMTNFKCSNGKCVKLSCGVYCKGCCDGETCRSGTSSSYCGKKGYSCSSCKSAYSCVQGYCLENTTCSSHTDCVSSKVCAKGSCSSPWGLNWGITVVSAVIAKKDPNGNDWDSWGEAPPDPYVEVVIGSVKKYSSVVPNSYTPKWDFTATGQLIGVGGEVSITILDADAVSSQEIDEVKYTMAVPVSELRKAVIKITATSTTDSLQELVYFFKPK